MFAAEDPADGARIALELQETFGASKDTPELRVGLAWGPVLARFGDLFGSVVNNAARLTGAARPGSILLDEKLAAELDPEEFRIQPLRRLRVKDFRRSRPFVLRARTGDAGHSDRILCRTILSLHDEPRGSRRRSVRMPPDRWAAG